MSIIAYNKSYNKQRMNMKTVFIIE